MGVASIIAAGIILGMLYLGLYLSTESEIERRVVGICTTIWVVVALYLFVFQWLFVTRHEMIGLVAITLLSTVGYMVGRAFASLTRPEWLEQ